MAVAPRLGRVSSFDEEVGLGDVRADDGSVYPFHCTEIADGSRLISAGAEVSFVVAPGHRGTWEARSVAPATRQLAPAP